MLVIAAAAALSAPLASSGAPRAQAVSAPITGTFIQVQPWMVALTPADWKAEIDAMRRAGVRTLILQALESGGVSLLPTTPSKRDPVGTILDYADAHGMEVLLGLRSDGGWWNRSADPAYLRTEVEANRRLAGKVHARYGKHRSFAGWYLPQETWDFGYNPDQIARLRGLFAAISETCRKLAPGKPVAIAPFFGGTTPPATVERVYSELLDGAGIDIVMLQDGVGARGWDREVAARVTPYFAAFRAACIAAGCELWSDLESFHLASREPLGFVPADADRIGRQLAAEAPYVKRFVTFDFFHYMSPRRGPQQKKLYDDYIRAFVDKPWRPLFGRSVQVDPGFDYYQDRSPGSIAAEIRANGYDTVLYVVTDEKSARTDLVDAFHREGIGVWLLTFGNGNYTTADMPAGWPSWSMVTRSDLLGTALHDGYFRMCLSNPEYRAWKKARMAKTVRDHGFDGVQIAEPHWPEYPGMTAPAYACFCPHCLAAFRRMFPEETALPDIIHADSPLSPGKNPDLWRKWLRFRVASLTDFLNDLVNGEGGLRKTVPDAKVCTWTLALENGLDRVREDSGEDAGLVAATVRPDMHCFQTHWPDWTRGDLPADYARRYQPFVDELRKAAPELPLMVQADTGSQAQNRRSWDWIHEFERTCNRMGVESTTLYEYFIGLYSYTDAPRVVDARPTADGVDLLFTKRLDAASAGNVQQYAPDLGRVVSATADGSVVHLKLEAIASRALCKLTISGITDDPARRLIPGLPAAAPSTQTIRFRR